MFDFLRRHDREDVSIDLGNGAINIRYHHRTRTAFLFTFDPDTPENAFDALEAHLKRRGYFLQIIVASTGMTPQRPE